MFAKPDLEPKLQQSPFRKDMGTSSHGQPQWLWVLAVNAGKENCSGELFRRGEELPAPAIHAGALEKQVITWPFTFRFLNLILSSNPRLNYI